MLDQQLPRLNPPVGCGLWTEPRIAGLFYFSPDMKHTLISILLLTTPPVFAEFYIDLGATYLDELEYTQRVSVSFMGITQSAEASATLDVEGWVPMVRFGYLWRGLGVELDYIGDSDTNLRRINVFYRVSFK